MAERVASVAHVERPTKPRGAFGLPPAAASNCYCKQVAVAAGKSRARDKAGAQVTFSHEISPSPSVCACTGCMGSVAPSPTFAATMGAAPQRRANRWCRVGAGTQLKPAHALIIAVGETVILLHPALLKQEFQ